MQFLLYLVPIILVLSFIMQSAWACTLTEEGAKKFELLCPTKKLESDCTCNINGVNIDVLSVVTALSYTDVIATIGIIIGGIVMVSALYIRRRRSRWKSQDDN